MMSIIMIVRATFKAMYWSVAIILQIWFGMSPSLHIIFEFRRERINKRQYFSFLSRLAVASHSYLEAKTKPILVLCTLLQFEDQFHLCDHFRIFISRCRLPFVPLCIMKSQGTHFRRHTCINTSTARKYRPT